MVMPRSRSMSIESRYWARMSRGSTAPVSSRTRSARVLFPWSMWAMIARFRIDAREDTSMRQREVWTETALRAPILTKLRSSRVLLTSVLPYGEHQEPDQAQPSERAPSRPQQGDALGGEDADQGGGDRGRVRCRGRGGGSAHRGDP